MLLLCFPALILGLVYAFFALMGLVNGTWTDDYGETFYYVDWNDVNMLFFTTIPWVIMAVTIWFLIAYFSNTSMIRHATGARPLERRENPRVYNIVENLTMACGMPMPKVNVIDDPMLNAFASGIDNNSYTVTVTTGICDRLNDDELAGVIAHELTHIRNRDTRLLIVSIIFVGLMSFVMEFMVRFAFRIFLGGNNRKNNGKGGAAVLIAAIIAIVLAAIGYLFTILTRLAISRKREYMADAGGAELCGNPRALASALRKISNNPGLGNTEREDVAQLFICSPKFSDSFTRFTSELFSTHPSIEKRIQILEQF